MDEKRISEQLIALAAKKGIDKEKLELLMIGAGKLPDDFMDVVEKASEVFNAEFGKAKADEQE